MYRYRSHHDCIYEIYNIPFSHTAFPFPGEKNVRSQEHPERCVCVCVCVCRVGSHDADGCDVMVDTRGPAVTVVAKPLQLFCWAGVGRRGASALRLLVF